MTDTGVTPPARTPGLRGRRPAVFPPELQRLGAYLISPLPAPSYPIDRSGGITAWGMDGNDQYGDCGFAGMAHKLMADAAVTGEALTPPTEEEVVTAYLAYDDGQDNGVVVSEMLNAWFTQGFFGQTIDAYVPIDHTNPAEIDSAMATFGAVILGVNLTDDADQLFSEGQPWTVANGETPDPNEGHVVVKIYSDPSIDKVVTWGADEEATKAWSAACIEEAWAVLTLEQAKRAGVAIDALLADLRKIGGGQVIPDPAPSPSPAPSPPVPTPTPTPAPTPSPAPVPPAPAPVEPIVEQLEHDAEAAVHEVEELAEDAIHAVEGEPPPSS